MTNAERILHVLDRELDHPVELTLFGRAALALGFPNPPVVVERSLDVDAIIPMAQLRKMEADAQFWSALDRANQELETEGLYLTHFFQEDQIVLASGWVDRRRPILSIPTTHLQLYRPSVADLILTKMMRGADAEDMADIRFLAAQQEFSAKALRTAIDAALLPEVPEVREMFGHARAKIEREFLVERRSTD
jgi:hypothetical protein